MYYFYEMRSHVLKSFQRGMTALKLMKLPNKLVVHLGRTVRFSTPDTSYWSTTGQLSLNA